MAHHHHHHLRAGSELQATSTDLLTALERSAMALNTIAHTLENEFSQRFGHTGVRTDHTPAAWAAQ